MKVKTINAVLNKTINDWTDSIKDDNVKLLAKNNIIVTGGSIASMLLNEEVKDFDIYFRTKESCKAIAEYYVKQFNENNKDRVPAYIIDGELIDISQYNDTERGMVCPYTHRNLTPDRIKIVASNTAIAEDATIQHEPFEDVFDVLNKKASEIINNDKKTDKYRPIYLSPNAITLTDKIQIVIRFHGDPEEIHKNYDFVHTTNYWTSWDNRVVLKQEALECLLNKELKYIGSKYPLCSIIRTKKFILRGFQINAGQYLNMLFQCSQLNLSNLDVLEDQLIGVDSAYFDAIIRGLRTKKESDPTFILTSQYLAELVNRVF